MSWQKRIVKDLADLRASGLEVLPEPDGAATAAVGAADEPEIRLDCFRVKLVGPPDTPYAGHAWHIRFTVPTNYPFSSPSVGFVQKILHPNVDWASGSICLDALNKKWSPIFTIKHIIESLLTYLLTYPNPDDPLNREAAALMRENPAAYTAKVLETTRRYAIKQ